MAWGIRVELTGLADLHARLEQMKRGIRNRIVRQALRKAGAPIRKAARAHLRPGVGQGQETRLLQRSIDIKDKTYSSSGVVILIIGPRNDFRQTVDVSHFRVYRQVGGVRGKSRRGAFIPGVFGKTTRITNPKPGKLKNWPVMMRNPVRYAHLVEKGISPRGHSDANPFLEEGFEQSKDEATEIFRDHVEGELLKYGVV